jgi:hypothetical protein
MAASPPPEKKRGPPNASGAYPNASGGNRVDAEETWKMRGNGSDRFENFQDRSEFAWETVWASPTVSKVSVRPNRSIPCCHLENYPFPNGVIFHGWAVRKTEKPDGPRRVRNTGHLQAAPPPWALRRVGFAIRRRLGGTCLIAVIFISGRVHSLPSIANVLTCARTPRGRVDGATPRSSRGPTNGVILSRGAHRRHLGTGDRLHGTAIIEGTHERGHPLTRRFTGGVPHHRALCSANSGWLEASAGQ